MSEITVVGGGIAGLTAAIACAEGGAKVRLLEAHEALVQADSTNLAKFKDVLEYLKHALHVGH